MEVNEKLRKILNELLLENQISKKTYEVLLKVDRALFLPENAKEYAYEDVPISIGFGQTCSSISIVAIMTDLLRIDSNCKVLEIGSGCGYQSAVLSMLAREVISIERIKELATFARKNIVNFRKKFSESCNVTIFEGDGSIGIRELAPYDRIIVTASAPSIPKSLVEQLSETGVMVIPVGDSHYQELLVYDKKSNLYTSHLPVIFVPLIGKEGWHDERR